MKIKTGILLLLIPLLFLQQMESQQTFIQKGPFVELNEAIQLFEKEKYVAAQALLHEIIKEDKTLNTQVVSDAKYYYALCAIELFNKDADDLIKSFIDEHPESPRLLEAKLYGARYFYRIKQYRKVLDWIGIIDQYELNREQLAEFLFMKGYSHFELKEVEEARLAFFEIKDVDTKYTSPAIYYYAHINYTQENYQTALDGFLRLQDDKYFAEIVPYYISQIYYLQGDYNKVIDYAPSFLEKVTEKRKAEVAKIIGESFFNVREYGNAIKYLSIYMNNTSKVRDEDYYQLGFAHYQMDSLENAAVFFEKISNKESRLGQNASYHLADCYLRTNEKNKALMAFSYASKLSFDKKIQEDALFNYALLTYELAYSPFSEAIKIFIEYISKFPDSRRIDDAYKFLVMAYLNTRNYKYALSSIEKIKNKNVEMEKAYQRIAYFRAIELFNNLDYQASIETMMLSLKYPNYDQSMKAAAYYWIGEAYYRQNKFQPAIDYYNKFILSPGAIRQPEYALAHYSLGYAYFKENEFTQSLEWFRKFSDLPNSSNPKELGDAYNRIGDIYFVGSNYNPAVKAYEKAVFVGSIDVDYALFQKAISNGLLQMHEIKINDLERLAKEYPNSNYIDDAFFELGKSALALNNTKKARSYYLQLAREYPNSSYHKKSLVQLGLISYNTDEYDQALSYYKEVVEKYPNSQEAKNSLLGIKNIYLEENNVDAYFKYVNSIGGPSAISRTEQDSLTYINAENIYMSGDLQKATNKFEDYLKQFSDGDFVLNAHYYLGDAYNKLKDTERAIPHFEYINDKPKNIFTEQSLLQTARIFYSSENYEASKEAYAKLETIAEINNNLLEARIGIMRCNFATKAYDETVQAALKVLSTQKIPLEFKQEARFLLAKSYYALEDYTKALNEFIQIAENVSTTEGAESKYRVCEILYMQNKLEKAEEEVYNFVDLNTPHQYWMAKAFILLADIFMKKNDSFQAAHTLQSIIDYYENKEDGIIELAKSKKSRILEKENIQYSDEESDIEITIDEN